MIIFNTILFNLFNISVVLIYLLRAVGISFRSPHHKRFHCMSNALLALIIKAV
jgi:hypothetical protein